jgi:hypothetical protein
MMPEEWPIAAHAADGSAHARLSGHGRLATVRIDFFLDPAQRLSEQERALMTVMLHQIVRDLANALRAALPSGWLAANDDDDAALIERLTKAGLLDEPDLIALLLRRADEERIWVASRARSGRREARALQTLVSNDNGPVAAAAMALILARGRRRDRFGQCLVAFDDLAPHSATTLINAVAAALREELASNRGAPEADCELAAAIDQVKVQRTPTRSIIILITDLVAQLAKADRLTEDLALTAANEGEVSFVAAYLAHLAGTETDVALEDLLSGDLQRFVSLLRQAEVSRNFASSLLAGIGDLLGVADAGEAIVLFDAMTTSDVDTIRSWLDADPAYRAAVDCLGLGRG